MSKRPVTIQDIEAGMVLFDAFDDRYHIDGVKCDDGVVRLVSSQTVPALELGPRKYMQTVWGAPVLYDLQFVLKNFRVVDLTDPIYSPQPPNALNPERE